MYFKELEADVYGGKAGMQAHNKREKAAAIERLKRNAEWNKRHKGKGKNKPEEE